MSHTFSEDQESRSGVAGFSFVLAQVSHEGWGKLLDRAAVIWKLDWGELMALTRLWTVEGTPWFPQGYSGCGSWHPKASNPREEARRTPRWLYDLVSPSNSLALPVLLCSLKEWVTTSSPTGKVRRIRLRLLKGGVSKPSETHSETTTAVMLMSHLKSFFAFLHLVELCDCRYLLLFAGNFLTIHFLFPGLKSNTCSL